MPSGTRALSELKWESELAQAEQMLFHSHCCTELLSRRALVPNGTRRILVGKVYLPEPSKSCFIVIVVRSSKAVGHSCLTALGKKRARKSICPSRPVVLWGIISRVHEFSFGTIIFLPIFSGNCVCTVRCTVKIHSCKIEGRWKLYKV